MIWIRKKKKKRKNQRERKGLQNCDGTSNWRHFCWGIVLQVKLEGLIWEHCRRRKASMVFKRLLLVLVLVFIAFILHLLICMFNFSLQLGNLQIYTTFSGVDMFFKLFVLQYRKFPFCFCGTLFHQVCLFQSIWLISKENIRTTLIQIDLRIRAS